MTSTDHAATRSTGASAAADPPGGDRRLLTHPTLRRRLEQANYDHSRVGRGLGVIHLELLRFREVNLRWGHGVGDHVLDAVQRRLLDALPSSSLVSSAGAAYTVLVVDIDQRDLRLLADRLVATTRADHRVGAVTVSLVVAAGFAWASAVDASPALLEQAFLAFRVGRQSDEVVATEYADAMSLDATRQQRLEAELHSALTDGTLRAHFQPVVDLRDGTVVGVEALIRWQHARDGLRMPADFLPIAEGAGMMPDLGQWMLDEVLVVLTELRAANYDPPLRVWINLSAHELDGAAQLCRRIAEAVADGSLSPEEIGFEVTESTLLEDIDSAVDSLGALRRLGVGIALDDFGTGYSSLSYLRRLPVTAVKIDRSFVAGLGGSLADEAIVEAVIDLAHALGLRVIAEGIEDEVQANALIAMGADEAQGFHFSRPAPIDALRPQLGLRWAGAPRPAEAGERSLDRRADALPGFGSPRARLLLAALDNAGDAIVVTSGTGSGRRGRRIIYVNAAFETQTGLQSRVVVGATMAALWGSAKDAALATWDAEVLASERSASRTVLWRRADAAPYLCDMTVSPIFDERGVLTHWLHIGRDVAERVAAHGPTDELRQEFDRVQLGVAEWALTVDADDVFSDVEVHLERLGQVLGADNVTLSTLHGDDLRRSARWPTDPASPLGVPPRLLHRDLLAKVPDLEPLLVDDIAECDADWAMEWRRNPAAPRSALIVPLGSAGRWHGVLGVVVDHEPRQWRDHEVVLVRYVAGTIANVLARRQLEDSLRATDRRLRLLLDGSPDLILVVDPEGAIEYANLAVRRLLGTASGDLLGRQVLEGVHPDDRALAAERLATLLARQPTNMTRLRVPRRDGTIGWWEITSGVQRDDASGSTILTCRDVSTHVETEQANARRVEHLRYSFDVAQLALDLGPDGFLAQLDDTCARIAEMLQADIVYVDQIDETRQELTMLGRFGSDRDVAAIDGEPVPFSVLTSWIARLRDPEPLRVATAHDATEPWLADKRRVFGVGGGQMAVAMSTAGELVGVIGASMVDATREWDDDEFAFLRIIAETIAHVLDRARLDAALRASEARFRILSETAADVVFLVDDRGTIAYVSPSSLALLGYTPEQLIGQHAGILLPAGTDDLIRLVNELTSDDASTTPTTELELCRADGSTIWVTHSTSTVLDARGSRVTYRISVRDITDRKRLETELSWQALHDPLTGLGNRIMLQRRLERATELGASTRGIAVLLIDLDRFKVINDTFGHAQGDEVLRIIARRLSSLTRPSDTLVRTGGDEFVVLCPDTEAQAAVLVAERIVRTLDRQLTAGGMAVTVGGSVGVAHHRGAALDHIDIVTEADQAMYRAKQAGGSCLRTAW